MTRRRLPIIALLVAMGGAFLAPPPCRATSLTPLNLADLVRNAPDIVIGTVSAVRQGTAGNLPYTEVELAVTDTLRGSAKKTLTFRSMGLQTPMAPVAGRVTVGRVPGVATYEVGEQVLLFLGTTSTRGFRAPVGLQQGKFSYGTGSVRNEFQNAGLFAVSLANHTLNEKEQAMVTTPKGALDSATFVGFVRRAVTENWWPQQGGAERPGPVPKKTYKKVGTPDGTPTAVKGTNNAN